MADNHESERPGKSAADAPGRGIPQGYRQGIITAITVLLGFSLAFLRFWSFEASGEWSWRAVVATVPLVVAIVLQIVALFRSLRLEDDAPAEYRRTVRYAIASAIVLLLGLLWAAFEIGH
ncbi:MAG: hypothetical protein JSR49_04040 [Proteobacteria bacterium]|nr:hypothetical protein [Pseudomonadota bacterium]